MFMLLHNNCWWHSPSSGCGCAGGACEGAGSSASSIKYNTQLLHLQYTQQIKCTINCDCDFTNYATDDDSCIAAKLFGNNSCSNIFLRKLD